MTHPACDQTDDGLLDSRLRPPLGEELSPILDYVSRYSPVALVAVDVVVKTNLVDCSPARNLGGSVVYRKLDMLLHTTATTRIFRVRVGS